MPGLEIHGIMRLLDPGQALELPHFQRSYAWRPKQVREYFDDLRASLDATGGPAEYFMGLVVIDDDRRIQDGQQRLATTLVFVQEIYAIAKALARAPDHDQNSFDDLNAIVAPLNSPRRPVLEISPQDQAALLGTVGIAATLPESARRLNDARRDLRALLDADLERLPVANRLARLNEWAAFLAEQAYVVELEVTPQAAHSIFETLNTRGVRLSNGDLVKSYLLARAANIGTGQQLWSEIVAALEDPAGDYEGNLDDFLYHYTGSRYARVSKEQLFKVFGAQTKDSDAIDVLRELRESAQLYAGLISPFEAPALRAHSDEAKYAIQFLNGVKLRQLRYLLLAVLRDYGSGQAARRRRSSQDQLIVKVAAWSIRGLVDGRTGGQSAQSLYVTAAKEIREARATTIEDVKALFMGKRLFIEGDGAFRAAFRTQRFDNQQAKSVLYELERTALGPDAAMELRDALTLEHVLPRNPPPGTWLAFSADEIAIYSQRMGNYLLLAQPFNSSLGNLEWPEKRQRIRAVRASQTLLTVRALRISKWDQDAIDRRHNQLARMASEHWSS